MHIFFSPDKGYFFNKKIVLTPAVASTIAASETRTRGIIFSVQGDNFL